MATDEGASDGHTAVMLRALGIPAVMGVAGLSAAARRGGTAVLDGDAGTVVLHPAPDTLEGAKQLLAAHARRSQRLARLRHLAALVPTG